jgi:hypothetical protein
MAPRIDYDRIWLARDGFYEEGGGVALCDERIKDDDVEYVNARLFNAQAAHAEELTVALHALVNNLPDLVLNLAGPEVGWSNVSAIRSARDAARAALEHKEA